MRVGHVPRARAVAAAARRPPLFRLNPCSCAGPIQCSRPLPLRRSGQWATRDCPSVAGCAASRSRACPPPAS
eukprot:4720000-Alexandrium_andersonii.AAC.1